MFSSVLHNPRRCVHNGRRWGQPGLPPSSRWRGWSSTPSGSSVSWNAVFTAWHGSLYYQLSVSAIAQALHSPLPNLFWCLSPAVSACLLWWGWKPCKNLRLGVEAAELVGILVGSRSHAAKLGSVPSAHRCGAMAYFESDCYH